MKILTILGARPQFIKSATVSRAIKEYNIACDDNAIEEIIIHTGQHFEYNMSGVFFDQLDIPKPHYNLGIYGLPHGAMTARMLERVEELVLQESPDWLLVYGDTNSTLAGALAAAKQNVKIGHIEAGLRSGNAQMPEEINRILTDRISTTLFCPTQTALDNLDKEGYPYPVANGTTQLIVNVGDVMYDAAFLYRDLAKRMVFLDKWELVENAYALCTLHRQSTVDNAQSLMDVVNAIIEISKEIKVILPIHPRTKERLRRLPAWRDLNNLLIVDPLPYLEMQRLLMGAKFVLTDSGGLQKEAFFHAVPCITMRDETEWPETVLHGGNVLAGTDYRRIVDASTKTAKVSTVSSYFGDGQAAKRIVDILAARY
jgi:UDP-GlcNAc3NAcA epimerase